MIAALLAPQSADRLFGATARGSLIPERSAVRLCFHTNCSVNEGMGRDRGVVMEGVEGGGGNRLKDLTQICLYIRLCMMEMLL